MFPGMCSQEQCPLGEERKQSGAEGEVDLCYSTSKALANPTENSGSGMTFQSQPKVEQECWYFCIYS